MDRVSRFQGTSVGPAVTATRNFAAAIFTLSGVVLLATAVFIGAPLPNSIIVAILAVGMISVAVTMSVRWRSILRRAKESAKSGDAVGYVVVMFVRSTSDSTVLPKYAGAGWVLVFNDRLELHMQGASTFDRNEQTATFAADDIRAVARSDRSAYAYPAVRITLDSGETITFTLAPKNGSGLRGPSDEEVDGAIKLFGSVRDS